MLSISEEAPLDIELENDEKDTVRLRDYLGSYVVIYFYPKDDTPGCTREAHSFRDHNLELQKMGVKIIGVSKDSVASHQKFRDKHALNFSLLADVDHKLAEAFGVWVEKNMMGKKYMGMQRSTFIINPQGTIVKVWPKVKPADHAREIISFMKEELGD